MCTTCQTSVEPEPHVSVTLTRQCPKRVAVVDSGNRSIGAVAVGFDGADLYLTEAGARRLLASLTVTIALLDSERDVPASEPTAVAS